ncbi:MAG: DUF4292 domain-containing protein [Polyangia bacterium]|jgi:hypothetical protein|nr:DUF4292 domain-containing protein [Polyangia bacterium]
MDPPKTLRARAKVDQWTPKGRIKVRVYLLASGEGQLRFEAVSPFDTPLLTLASSGGRFTSIDHKNNVFYTGPAKPCNIARVFGLALEPREVARALSGGAPLIEHSEALSRWDRCKGAEEVILKGKGGLIQRVWLSRKEGLFRVDRSEVKDSKGKILLSLSFERHRLHGGRWVPEVVKFEQPSRKSDVIIRYQKVELDVEIPSDAYRLSPPAGLPEQEMDCDDE